MAFTGPLAFPTPTPPPHSRARTKVRGDAISPPSSTSATSVPNSSPSSTSSPSTSTVPEQPKVREFSYTRATPSVRWPGLRLEDYIPNTTSSKPQFPPPSAVHLLDPELEITSGLSEPPEKPPYDEDGGRDEPLETLDGKQSRTRAKKMTKLALKRAKDWRQRVQLLTDRILALGPSDFVADVLDQRAVQMTPTDYCFVVKWVGRSSWQRALEVYEWLNLRRWYAPNARMLAGIISVLGRAHQEALAEEVFRRAESEADVSAAGTATVQVYNAMMGVYARSGKFFRVQEMLRLMRERGCEPDLVSFNTLINSKAKSGQMPSGTAIELLNEVRRSKLRPDTITYNTLISACSYGSNLEEAMNIYKDMEASNCQPDLWTYNAMVSVYGRCGMTQEAERLFCELGEKGFCPDAVTFNSLVYAFAREGNVEKVECVCANMVGAGFKKDEITYNTIIHMYGKQGRHDLAFQLYRDMKLNGCKPDAVTYTVLIDLLGKADRIMEAANVMSDMLDSGVRPTLRTFSALICGYAKAGMRVEAEQTFDHMLRSGIKPDCLAYSVMLDILLRFNETRKAIVLYRDMVRNEFKPDSGLYQILIGVLAKENKENDIEDLVKDMREICRMSPTMISSTLVKGGCFDLGAAMLKEAAVQGYDPDKENLLSILNSYNSSGRHDEAHALLDFLRECAPNSHGFLTEASITILCNNQQLEAATEEYNKMRWSGFKSYGGSHNVYESLIMCCEESESFPEACQIFSDMKFYGLKPSQNIYRIMLSIYCRISFPETAHSLLDEAERTGILFDDVSLYVTLIEAHGKLKQWQRAESLVGKLRLQSTVDRKVWNALIFAYAESGRYEQARAIFNTMVRDGPSPSVDSVNGLMKALIIDGRLDELYVVIEELQDMDFKISKSTILLMLDAFAGARNIFEVKKIYHGMKAAGYLPTMHVYRSMVSVLSHGKRVRDVESIVAEMEEAGFKPDLAIFNSMLRMYTAIGDFKKTTEVYQRIQEAGFQADEETYHSIILMYSRDRRPEEGLSLLSEMKKQGLEPKLDTYKSLLAACGREKLWEQAEDIFESIQSKGRRLNRSVYHTMMKIYRDCGNHSRAEHVLFLMKEAGVEPTIATMHMLMVSYGTAGQPQEAENVLNNLKSSGMNLSTLPYASVIDSYLKNGDYNMGVEKLLGMKREGVEPDHRIWTCFIRTASLCQQTSEAMDLLNSLRDTGFDIPIRLLTQKTESLVVEADLLLENLGSEDNASFNFVNALVDLLWAFDRRATASWVFQLAIKKAIYRHDLFRVADKDWGADFRKLSAGAALVGLTLWLDHMQDASLQGMPESPKSVVLITGTAEYHMVSLNNTLKAYLWEMGSPFLPCKTRTGVLVAKAHSLRMWLKDSSFCMDLELKDAPFIPKSNSMQLTEGYFMRAGLVPAFKEIRDRMGGQVRPKKFARLALLSEERRDNAITADIEGRKEKLEKMKRRGGSVRARRPTRLRTSKIMRRQHQQRVK